MDLAAQAKVQALWLGDEEDVSVSLPEEEIQSGGCGNQMKGELLWAFLRKVADMCKFDVKVYSPYLFQKAKCRIQKCSQ